MGLGPSRVPRSSGTVPYAVVVGSQTGCPRRGFSLAPVLKDGTLPRGDRTGTDESECLPGKGG